MQGHYGERALLTQIYFTRLHIITKHFVQRRSAGRFSQISKDVIKYIL